MSARLAAIASVLLALGPGAGCGSPLPGPDEVTTPVTAGDEEAWSRPGDPAPPEEDPDAQDDEEGEDAEPDGDGAS